MRFCYLLILFLTIFSFQGKTEELSLDPYYMDSINQEDEIKMARVVKYISDNGEIILSEEQNVNKSLERINQKFKQDEFFFQLETGFSVGITALLIYLRRENILSLAKYTGTKAHQLATFTYNGFANTPALGLTFAFLNALTFTYFYKYELADGTLLAHYINNLNEFLNLPQDAQVDFIVSCRVIDQRYELCDQFEQKIIALDQFIGAAIEQKIEQNNNDKSIERVNKKIAKRKL